MAWALLDLLGSTSLSKGVKRAYAACDRGHAAAGRMLGKAGFRAARLLPRNRVHPALGTEPRDCVLFVRQLEP